MAQVQVVMPKMGESITEGTVIAWSKQVGDTIEVDETLLEIGTDKVDTEVPSPSAGRVSAILVGEGETVEVGAPIAVIETDVNADVSQGGDGGAPSEAPAVSQAPAAATPASEPTPPAAAPEPERTASESAAAPQQTAPSGELADVVMPKMGESIMEGTITKWHKAPGESIDVDETLLEIATDKVDSDVPSPVAGVLSEILFQEGDTVDVGSVIAKIAVGSGGASQPGTVQSAPAPTQSASPPASASSAPAQSSAPVATSDVSAGGNGVVGRTTEDGRFLSPLVRSIAMKEGLSPSELQSISGSGQDGRVTKSDVMDYLASRGEAAPEQGSQGQATAVEQAAPARPQPASSQPAPSQRPAAPAPPPVSAPPVEAGDRVEVVEMDRMRQIIAQHMIQSKQTSAHVTSFAEADLTNLVKLRESQKKAFLEREGIKLTYTPFFVHAAVDALRAHPIMNSSVEGTRILMKKDFHVGIAVAIGKAGLVVPVIRYAGHKNIAGLAREAANLADRARSRQLQPDDLQGGTFTVTNIGSLGSIMGTPIIAQPQVAILATGAIKKRPVVVEDPNLGDVSTIRNMMYVSLSYDHRIIDGAMASSFLHHFVQVVESFGPDTEL